MGTLREPSPVKLFIGLLYNDESLLTTVQDELGFRFGVIDGCSVVLPWDVTHFYTEEMGPVLMRRFVSHAGLIAPDRLAEIKLTTREIEGRHRWSRGERTGRGVNIDPGYVEAGKVVLASTKNACHRIYLSSGIYAEATLAYQSGAFKAFPTTYPDYRWAESLAFFTNVRSIYLKQLRETKKHGY